MVAFVAVGAIFAVVGIRGCRKQASPIATLNDVLSGRASRSKADGEWQPSSRGDRFYRGDTLRTSSDGSARLNFGKGAFLRLGNSTTIRFDDVLDVDGELSNDSSRRTTLMLSIGKTTLEEGATIRIRGGDKNDPQADSRLEVLVGSAVVTTADGLVSLSQGESISVEVRGASVVNVPIDAGSLESIDAAPIPPDAAPIVQNVTIVVSGRGASVKSDPDAKSSRLRAGSHELPTGAVVATKSKARISFTRGVESAVLSGRSSATIGGKGAPLISVTRGKVRLTAVSRRQRLQFLADEWSLAERAAVAAPSTLESAAAKPG